MPDATNPTFIESTRARINKFVEKAAGVIGINLPHQPTGFIEVHEKTTELLLQAEQDRVFGIDAENSGLDNKDLEMMIGLIQKLEQLASEGEGATNESILGLIPEEAVIRKGRDNNYIVEMLGVKINTTGKEKEIDLKEAFRLAKEEYQSHYTEDKKWRNPKDKEKWESMSPEDRQRIAGMRKVLGAVGFNPDSIADGNLGVTRFKYVDKKTGREIGTEDGARVARFEPLLVNGLVNPDTGQTFELKDTDKKGPRYTGKLKDKWPQGNYVTVVRNNQTIILRIEAVPAKNEAVAITAQGKKIEVAIKEEIESIFPKTDGEEFQEISLRQLLINITRKKQGELADAYLTALIKQGRKIGFQEDGAARGIVVEGVSPGGPRYETLMTALHRGGVYDKWRAIATLSEQNERFQMLFGARNRDEAQKSMEGGKLSRLASADNIADWLEKIPDMAATLGWQEFQGFRHPKTGEPIDYPAVDFDVSLVNVLLDRLAKNLISKVIRYDGSELSGEDLKNYRGNPGDIFVLKPAKTEHKSMALLNVLKERARYLGVETYVVDLAFAFHRVMFTGQDKGISYNKAMTVGDFWQIADIFGLGQQIKENYAQLTAKQKAEFEKAITQTSIFQTGVDSFFSMVFGMRDENTLNRDRVFRKAWKDRAPVYGGGPPEWVRERINWSKRVNWSVESARREIYRWMGEFSYSIGKGLKDVTGEFAGAETPFNWENSHHMNALVDHLLTSEAAAAELKRVGFDPKTLTRPQLEGLIKQIFADKKLPEAGRTNFLGELKKFDETLGYERAANAQSKDFSSVDQRFRDAVRLEKALESASIFGNLLEFRGGNGWDANQDLIEQVRGAGGIINDGSYDRMVHNMLYWYQNYLIGFDNFIKLRLGKEPAAVEDVGRKALFQWQDQNQQDVRGTPQAFILHYLNELNEEFIDAEIRDKKMSHVQLNELHEQKRLWRDAVIFYGEPELDPAKHEVMIKEYCRQRMLRLHRRTDLVYIDLLRKRQKGLQDVAGLVDPDGNVQMFKWAVPVEGGRLVGPGEGPNGEDTAEYLKAYQEAKARFYTSASNLQAASHLYQLDMGSVWSDKLEIQTVSMDGQGLYKYEIMQTWYGVLDNEEPLYTQVLDWYKQLRDLPKTSWDRMERGEYVGIPEILVGIAREYLHVNLRANNEEATIARQFFRNFLYYEDMGGYQPGATRVFNQETREFETAGTPAFNKAFQILIALMLAKDVGANGVPEDQSKGPGIEELRYFLFLNTHRALIKGYEEKAEPDARATAERMIDFYDFLVNERRVGKQTWAEFFKESGAESLASKQTIVEEIASLYRRDRMFSWAYNKYGEVIQQWLGLSKRPDAPDFNMGEEVGNRLRILTGAGSLNEVREILDHLSGEIVSGNVKATDIRSINKFIIKEYGLRILPRFYWLTRFFRKINHSDIEQILTDKLPQAKQARRWVFMNYGIDIGDQANMAGVYQAIADKVPVKWEDENRKKPAYLNSLLEVRKKFRGAGILRFIFGYNWLDETGFSKPHIDAARSYLVGLHSRITKIPASSYFGFLRQSKETAQASRYFYELKLIAGQLAMTDEEKVKKYLELRSYVPFGQYSWHYLELASEELFGFASRPLDFNTDFNLTMEYAPLPVLSAATSILSSWGPLKWLGSADKFIKMYLDAPVGALPIAAVTVGLPLAAIGTIGLGWGLGLGFVGYELANVIGRWAWAKRNKKLDEQKIIERHPKIAFLIHKGIVKG
jgi:hypothetical protein